MFYILAELQLVCINVVTQTPSYADSSFTGPPSLLTTFSLTILSELGSLLTILFPLLLIGGKNSGTSPTLSWCGSVLKLVSKFLCLLASLSLVVYLSKVASDLCFLSPMDEIIMVRKYLFQKQPDWNQLEYLTYAWSNVQSICVCHRMEVAYIIVVTTILKSINSLLMFTTHQGLFEEYFRWNSHCGSWSKFSTCGICLIIL